MARPAPDAALGEPSERSAVLVRAHLPAGLARLRRASIADAAEGVPPHLTLLYPFVAPERLDAAVRRRLAAVVRGHAPFAYDLRGQARCPDTIYVAVAPVAPFVRLQRDLQAAFPAFPIYGRPASFRFVPHVSIAEEPAVRDPAVRADPGWSSLPRPAFAGAVEVIERGADGWWRTRWRLPLGR